MKLINPLIIIRILSTILLVETIAVLSCLPVALLYKESPAPFLITALFTFLIYGAGRIIGRNADMNRFSNRDGYLSVTLAWILFSAMGALPYIFSGTIPNFINAFFESSSGFSTTGSSILTDVEVLPYSILYWRSFTHWIGGVGIIVLVLIILPSLRITGYQLFSLESSMKEKIHPQTKGIVIRVMIIYFGLTIAQIIFLVLGDMTLFDAVCYSYGTIATGGFATRNSSLQFYSSYNQYVVMIFMFLAGTSQVVYYHLGKLNFKKVKQNEELWLYIAVTAVAGALAFALLYFRAGRDFEDSFRAGFFQVISIITSTGFASEDFLLWPSAGLLLIFLLMFCGGSTGSTTGGIKIARHLIVIKNIKSTFRRLHHPNAVSTIKLNGKVISDSTNISILSFVILFIFLFFVGTIILTINGSDPVTAATSAAASMANIGPGLGTVGPMSNYAHMPQFSKLVLSFLMIIGRLEIITVFALFSRSFWRL